MMNFLSRLLPFGKKEALEVPQKTREKIYSLVTEFPELWEALKEVGYIMMNQKARNMVLTDKDKREDYVKEILAIDGFIKTCLNIKEQQKDDEVELSGHLPVLKEAMKREEKLVKRGKEKNIFFYLASKDLKGGRVTPEK